MQSSKAAQLRRLGRTRATHSAIIPASKRSTTWVRIQGMKFARVRRDSASWHLASFPP